MPPLVVIVLVNFNSHEHTLDCLRSLRSLSYPRVEVVVVDNGSKPESIEAIRTAFPDVTLLETGQNLGFTGGNNVGIRYALDKSAEFIMLLNNDTVVAPDMLNILISKLQSDQTIGVIGPVIYYFDHPDTIWSAGGRIDWRTGTTTMLGLNEPDRGQFGDQSAEVNFVTGCALLARSEVWKKVGLLDDDFFLYYEETEWCVRAGRAGYRILVVPQAMIWHKISITARAASPMVYYYMTRNRLLFLRKTGARLSTWARVWIEYVRTFLSWTIKPQWKDRRHLRSVMRRAITDYYRGRLGMQPH